MVGLNLPTRFTPQTKRVNDLPDQAQRLAAMKLLVKISESEPQKKQTPVPSNRPGGFVWGAENLRGPQYGKHMLHTPKPGLSPRTPEK